jgi:hypothetical protein
MAEQYDLGPATRWCSRNSRPTSLRSPRHLPEPGHLVALNCKRRGCSMSPRGPFGQQRHSGWRSSDAKLSARAAIVPLERCRVPAGLDGSQWRFYAPTEQWHLTPANDYEALLAWLASKRAASGDSSHGQCHELDFSRTAANTLAPGGGR